MKIENRNIVLALVFGFATLSFVTTFVDGTFATNNTDSSISEAVDLGSPFLVQQYQTVAEKPDTTTNMSLTDSFVGKGVPMGLWLSMLKGMLLRPSEIMKHPIYKELQSMRPMVVAWHHTTSRQLANTIKMVLSKVRERRFLVMVLQESSLF